MSKMMRISDNTDKNLDELKNILGTSKQTILEKAVDLYIREQFLKKTNEEYAQLQKDPKAWAEELEERALWDVTLADGLDDE